MSVRVLAEPDDLAGVVDSPRGARQARRKRAGHAFVRQGAENGDSALMCPEYGMAREGGWSGGAFANNLAEPVDAIPEAESAFIQCPEVKSRRRCEMNARRSPRRVSPCPQSVCGD